MIEIMHQKTIGFSGFINTEIITSFFPAKMYFQYGIEPELVAQKIIQLQTELVIFYRCRYTQKPCIIKEVFIKFFNVQS